MTNAGEITQRYGEGFKTIPWLAILSPDGEVLTDSRLGGRNIGFPSREEARQHFRKMFQTTAKRIRDAEIESLIECTKGE